MQEKFEKFLNASLEPFETSSLFATLQAMETIIRAKAGTPEVQYDAYAVFGKVTLELERREEI